VRLQVQDNGKGFDPAAVRGEKSFGQATMRERAERIAGALEIFSVPGEVTRVSLTVKPVLPHTKTWLLAALSSMEDAIITADALGKVTYLNPSAEALTGWKATEAIGQDVAAVYQVVDEETGNALQRLLVDIAPGRGGSSSRAGHRSHRQEREAEPDSGDRSPHSGCRRS